MVRMLKRLLWPLWSLVGRKIPSDVFAKRYPVSVKGILVQDGQVVLLKNEREEWELPGGKLDPGESLEECLAREIAEELGVGVKVGNMVDAWVYDILGKVKVVILTYHCHTSVPFAQIQISSEHKALGQFSLEAIDDLPMPNGYKKTIWKVMGNKKPRP